MNNCTITSVLYFMITLLCQSPLYVRLVSLFSFVFVFAFTMPGGKTKWKTQCPGCHIAHSKHYFGPLGLQRTGHQEKERNSDD